MNFGAKKAVTSAVLLGTLSSSSRKSSQVLDLNIPAKNGSYAANAPAFWQGSQIAKDESSSNAGTVYAIVFLILDASFVIRGAGPLIRPFAQATSAGRRIFNYPDIRINMTQRKECKLTKRPLDQATASSSKT